MEDVAQSSKARVDEHGLERVEFTLDRRPGHPVKVASDHLKGFLCMPNERVKRFCAAGARAQGYGRVP